jgi:Flp pilus assembly protein TadD
MQTLEERYDDAMFDFSQADYDSAIEKLRAILEERPEHFDARLALGMAHYRKGEYPTAIEEGHKAEQLRPQEQLVHTNLSLFYMKSGDKTKAEHHGLQARLASWREKSPMPGSPSEDELRLAKPAPPPPPPPPEQWPEMPWKKKP